MRFISNERLECHFCTYTRFFFYCIRVLLIGYIPHFPNKPHMHESQLLEARDILKYNFVMKCLITIFWSTKGKVATKIALVHLGPIYPLVLRVPHVLFQDTLNTFYLRLYGVRHMVKDHSDSQRGNQPLPHGILFPVLAGTGNSSMGRDTKLLIGKN